MSFSKSINAFRRKLMRGLTKNVGTSKGNFSNPSSINRILISRPNKRLGNLLLVTPLLREIEHTFPSAKIDLFVRGGLAKILYQQYPQVDRIIELPGKPFKQLIKYMSVWIRLRKYSYDLVINLQEDSSSGRLSTALAKSSNKFFGEADMPSDEKHFAKIPVYNFRNYIQQMGLPSAFGPVPAPDLRLTESEKIHGKQLLESLFPDSRPVICIFTFATGDKKLDRNWWDTFYNQLQSDYPNYNILEILPMENVSQIDFRCTSFYSRDVREIGAVIANTELFIGADSGIMHLASSVQTPVLGLFKVTDPLKYESYNRNSISYDATGEKICGRLFGCIQSILSGKTTQSVLRTTTGFLTLTADFM
ncbi:glycosyltransferase family 9 protein [Flavobacterium silvaticum]|uniref:Glycosyltransferase family 9 protein n=1 Tax=Flavobacterium silvaticum TaxID=1852020 RepID=A0A972FJ62_9FLAO|nr:glycosyltransferase family 9 protein [Flavobacterium silvaticum]NMH27009.1 glycosyltransferase family 9 protein [Flavobacterium silvaticum]